MWTLEKIEWLFYLNLNHTCECRCYRVVSCIHEGKMPKKVICAIQAQAGIFILFLCSSVDRTVSIFRYFAGL